MSVSCAQAASEAQTIKLTRRSALRQARMGASSWRWIMGVVLVAGCAGLVRSCAPKAASASARRWLIGGRRRHAGRPERRSRIPGIPRRWALTLLRVGRIRCSGVHALARFKEPRAGLRQALLEGRQEGLRSLRRVVFGLQLSQTADSAEEPGISIAQAAQTACGPRARFFGRR